MAEIISAKQFGFTSLGSLIVVVEIRYNIIQQAFCFLGQEIFFSGLLMAQQHTGFFMHIYMRVILYGEQQSHVKFKVVLCEE